MLASGRDEGRTGGTLRRLAVVLLSLVAGISGAAAAPKTVCTITVNSADEKQSFSRALPPDKYQFVELVEPGRDDWLASACSRDIRCDVLVISGHYDGGKEFFPDSLEKEEYLPVDDLERASCGESCGLFSQLKEVYLFGCNTLNPEAVNGISADVGRSLLKAGHSKADVDRLSRALGARHGESSRDRMRLVFNNVPAIYGFSSVAPLGPVAATLLDRHFRAGGASEVGSGRPSARLLGQFAGKSLTVTAGLKDDDVQAAHRRDVCQFADDRIGVPQRLAFVHSLMQRDMAEVRLFVDRLEQATTLPDDLRDAPDVAAALATIARDAVARDRYLALVHDTDDLPVRVRLLAIARNVGWLDPSEHRAELVRMIAAEAARPRVGAAEVDLVCSLPADPGLQRAAAELRATLPPAHDAGASAMFACLGDRDGHRELLQAMASGDENAVLIAQVYLRHRPLDDVAELREMTAGIARMRGAAAQVRALDALAKLRLSDAPSLEALARLFPATDSAGVQTAIAGVFLRSDYDAIDRPELVQTLRQHRLKTAAGDGLIDVLIRRLQAN